MRALLVMAAAMSLACEDCHIERSNDIADPRVSLIGADGKPVDGAAPGVILVVEGRAGDCASADRCTLTVGDDGRLNFAMSGEFCLGYNEYRSSLCVGADVRCISPPLPAGDYEMPYLLGYHVDGQSAGTYRFTVGEAAPVLEPIPEPLP